jgi:hypothetical protein
MSQRYIRNSGVITRAVAGETIVVPVRGGVGDLDGLFTFNELGSDIWAYLETGHTADEVVDWVSGRYAVSLEQARADVSVFLSELREQGLISATSGG